MSSSGDLRVSPPTDIDTIRTQLMEYIAATCKSALWLLADTEPSSGLLFDTVKYGTLDDIAAGETPGCAIEEGTEEVKSYMDSNYGTTQKIMRVLFNIKVVRSAGLDPAPTINYYFGRIVQLFVTVPNLAGLAINVSEAGNSIQTLGPNDPEPGGIIYLDVEYRHKLGDPFTE